MQDETSLIWISNGGEKRLKLATVSKIVPGQRTVISLEILLLFVLMKQITKAAKLLVFWLVTYYDSLIMFILSGCFPTLPSS